MVAYALDYRIEANGKDITELLRGQVSQLTITDEAGYKSDKLSLTLADSGIALPEPGAELTAYVGYRNELRLMGKYIVDTVTLNFPPDSMAISANAAPFEQSKNGMTPLQSQKSRSFPAGTIYDLVMTIANDHNLAPALDAGLAKVQLSHIDQSDESDMNLLTRIAKQYDAIAKANGGRLLFVKRGEGKSTTGAAMPKIHITKEQVTSGSVKISQCRAFKQVVATYRDTAGAMNVEVAAGKGEPVHRIKGVFSDSVQASAAAQKQLKAFERGKRTLSLSIPFAPDLVAESRIILKDFRSGIDGEWGVTRATHTINSSGGITAIEAEFVV